MQNYLDLLREVKDLGVIKGDRTGMGTKSIFGRELRFDLAQGFPMITTKKIHLKSIIYELLWFLKGDTNIHYLNKHGVKIWDEWADENGDLGPVYGQQWRAWKTSEGRTIDQISDAMNLIKHNPNSRRIKVSAWNPEFLPDETISPQENVRNGKAALACCHDGFQFYVAQGKLSCRMQQRSVDTFLGLPFNIASYALLTHMFAHVAHLEVGELSLSLGDTHIYLNHMDVANLQLQRTPKKLPQLNITRRVYSILDFSYDDFEVVGYEAHPHIAAEISI